MDLALNNIQRLICHKTQQTKLNRGHFFHLRFLCDITIYEIEKKMEPLVTVSMLRRDLNETLSRRYEKRWFAKN